MDFYVVLNRPGYRVAKRKAKCAKIGYPHKVTKTDAVKWFQVRHDTLRISAPPSFRKCSTHLFGYNFRAVCGRLRLKLGNGQCKCGWLTNFPCLLCPCRRSSRAS